nr:hypothetical protein [Agrobacterium rosae]
MIAIISSSITNQGCCCHLKIAFAVKITARFGGGGMRAITLLCSSFLFLTSLTLPVLAEPLPAPVNGVTFEEWASANGRIANEQDPKDVIAVLDIDERTFEQINLSFIEALKNADTAGDTMRVYGEAFGDPNRGRFSKTEKVQIEGKLATFDDYARLQGHMEASGELGITPQQVLDEHNLTPYEYAEESKRWMGRLVAEASKEHGADATAKWHEAIFAYKAEYLKKRGK